MAAAAACSLVLCEAGPASALTNYLSPYYGGYGAGQKGVTQAGIHDVESLWTVPTVHCETKLDSNLSMWVGLDNSLQLIQAGVIAKCRRGVASYFGFYEQAPEPDSTATDVYTEVPSFLHAGDRVYVQVYQQDVGYRYFTTFENATTQKTINFQSDQTYNAPFRALCVLENPNLKPYRLAAFGKATFDYCDADDGNNPFWSVAKPASDSTSAARLWKISRFAMVTRSSSPQQSAALTSWPSSDGHIDITWRHA